MDYLLSALKSNFRDVFKQYLNKPQWMTVNEDDDSIPAITAELDQPLIVSQPSRTQRIDQLTGKQIIRDQISFLRRAIGTSDYRRICRVTFNALEDILWNEVLLKQEFTTLGARRFRQDVIAIETTAHTLFGSETIIMLKLVEGSQLLSLALQPQEGPSLMEAANSIFGRKEDADEMLFENLQFVVMSRQEARSVMQRRREATN